MKRITLFLLVFFLCLTASRAQSGFRITGKAMGSPNGKLLLLVQHLDRMDTLATCDMVNSEFRFEGQVDAPCVGLIEMAGMKGAIPLMLENTDINVNIGVTGIFVEGGESQQVYNEYFELMSEGGRELKKMMEEYKTAVGLQDQMKANILQKQIMKLREEIVAKELEWIKENGNHFVAAYILQTTVQQGLPYEEAKKRFDLLGPDAKASTYGQIVCMTIDLQSKSAVGAVAPNFKVNTPEGTPISLYDVKGKVKLIDFWASWCKPCRDENKNVVKLYEKYHKKGLEIFGVSMDTDAAKWKEAIEKDGLAWYHGSDLKGLKESLVARFFFVKAIPHTILLDENNRIVAKNLRGEDLKKKVAEMLKQ